MRILRRRDFGRIKATIYYSILNCIKKRRFSPAFFLSKLLLFCEKLSVYVELITVKVYIGICAVGVGKGFYIGIACPLGAGFADENTVYYINII